MRSVRAAVLALGCCWLTAAPAQEAEPEAPGPDLDFLEYLGAWAEEDDEWLAIEEWQRDKREDLEAESPPEKPKDEDHESE